MRIELHGEPVELADGASLGDAVRAKLGGEEPARRGLAVALDGEVVPRAEWDSTELVDGGRVEVLAAIQGGAR
jgi:sulfur carrier protein